MKVSRMNKISIGKLRAFFDLELDNGITIKGFKLVEGINGLFVGMPTEKDKNGEYRETIFCKKDVRGEINMIALNEYNSEVEEVREVSQDIPEPKTSDDIPF
tara:strand:- start:1188 stop:1493 length:306 start_codon:yes stop_codon:yes gene_type:complete